MFGTIKKIVQDKGFGFIQVEDRDKDLFFHMSAVIGGAKTFKSLKEGDAVKFKDIVNNGRGESAVDVELEQ